MTGKFYLIDNDDLLLSQFRAETVFFIYEKITCDKTITDEESINKNSAVLFAAMAQAIGSFVGNVCPDPVLATTVFMKNMIEVARTETAGAMADSVIEKAMRMRS